MEKRHQMTGRIPCLIRTANESYGKEREGLALWNSPGTMNTFHSRQKGVVNSSNRSAGEPL